MAYASKRMRETGGYALPLDAQSEKRSEFVAEFYALPEHTRNIVEDEHRASVCARRAGVQIAGGSVGVSHEAPWGIGDERWPIPVETMSTFLETFEKKEPGLSYLRDCSLVDADGIRALAVDYHRNSAGILFARGVLGISQRASSLSGVDSWTQGEILDSTPATKCCTQKPCGEKHFGFCITRHADISTTVKLLVGALGATVGNDRLQDRFTHTLRFSSATANKAMFVLAMGGTLKPATQVYLVCHAPDFEPQHGTNFYSVADLAALPCALKFASVEQAPYGSLPHALTEHQLAVMLAEAGLAAAWRIDVCKAECTGAMTRFVVEVIYTTDTADPLPPAAVAEPDGVAAAPADVDVDDVAYFNEGFQDIFGHLGEHARPIRVPPDFVGIVDDEDEDDDVLLRQLHGPIWRLGDGASDLFSSESDNEIKVADLKDLIDVGDLDDDVEKGTVWV
jgi:hypothetical protein